MRLAPSAPLALLVAAALTACEGRPAGWEAEPGAECDAIPITAEHAFEPGAWRIEVAPGPAALGGLCPVSDPSIRQGGDALFAFVAPRAGRYHFRKIGSATMASLHAGCAPDAAPLACAPSPNHHDAGLGRWPLGVSRALAEGEAVLIHVDGFGAPQRLGLTVTGPSPEGAPCGALRCDADDWCAVAGCVEGAQCFEGLCAVPPPPGGVGAACDAVVTCADGLYCAAGACVDAPAPALLSAWAHRAPEGDPVFASMRIDDPARVIEGGRLQLEGGGPGADLDFGDPRLAHLRAHDAADAEAVELVDADGRVWFRQRIEPQPIRAAGEPCTPNSEVDRCAEGTVCPPGDAPRCAPVEVFVWTDRALPGHIVVDIRGAALGASRVFAGPLIPMVHSGPDRWIGRSAVPVAGPVDVRYAEHPVAAAVPVLDPPAVARGEACDPQRVADHCLDGDACIGGVCRAIGPPVVDAAIVVDTREGAAVWIRGRDPDGDVSGVRVGGRAFDLRFGPPAAGVDRAAAEGVIEGEVFEAWVSTERRVFGDAVVAIDAEGLESAPFVAERAEPAERPRGEAGAACDPLGLLWPCADGLKCHRRDGVDVGPRCAALEPACPAGLATPIALGEAVAFDAEGPTAHTETLCRPFFGAAAEHYLRFVAPEAGGYLVTAIGDNGFGLAVRRGCLQPYSEVACAEEFFRTNPAGHGGHGIGASLWVQAEAGEPLTIVVDGMPRVTVTVEPW